jgi:ankyrin repeat protein
MKPYFPGSIILALLLLLVGCTASPNDGAKLCRSADKIRKHVEANGDPNLQVTIRTGNSSDGELIESLLACAVESEDLPLVKLVVEKGAKINRRDVSRSAAAPLHHARNVDIAKFLLDKGAETNAKTLTGDTPLFWAASPEIASLLIDRGANVKAINQQGETPLHRFTGGQTVNGEYKKLKLQSSQLLISGGADVNAPDFEGNSPLHKVSDPDIAELLLAHGANVNAKNKKLQTPLHTVASRTCRNSAALDFLLRKGADVNAQDNTGQTPLHISIEYGGALCKDRIFTLLKYGADVDLKDRSGSSPLNQAIQNYERWIEPYKEINGLPESDQKAMQKAMQEEEAIINALKERHRVKNK